MSDDIQLILRRMDAIERNQSDNAKSLTAVIENSHGLSSRISALETIQHERRVDDAKRNAREEAMQKDITGIREDITSIKGFGTWALRIVAGAVILAFIGFILRGGPLGG